MSHEREEIKPKAPASGKWQRLRMRAPWLFSTQTAITLFMLAILIVFARQNACHWIPESSFYWYDQFDCYSQRGPHIYPVR